MDWQQLTKQLDELTNPVIREQIRSDPKLQEALVEQYSALCDTLIDIHLLKKEERRPVVVPPSLLKE